jgi:hypothetical protein
MRGKQHVEMVEGNSRRDDRTRRDSGCGGACGRGDVGVVGQVGHLANGGYTVRNDVWGSGAGPQTIWANSYSNWESGRTTRTPAA